jgi:hypothetical protein
MGVSQRLFFLAQVNLELIIIFLSFLSAGITGMCHHAQPYSKLLRA